MNKKKIEKSLEWHKKKVAELEEALKQPDNKRWFPKKDEKYYGIRDGKVRDCFNYNEDCTESMYSVNTVFKTEKEAEKELSRRKAETELLDMCCFGGDVEIIYSFKTDNFDTVGRDDSVDKDRYFICSPYRFKDTKSAKEAITKLGKEKLKLIFRV